MGPPLQRPRRSVRPTRLGAPRTIGRRSCGLTGSTLRRPSQSSETTSLGHSHSYSAVVTQLRRIYSWIYPPMLLALGVGFLAWSFSQGNDADAYKRASLCASVVNSSCYELVSGQIASVAVSQSSRGEEDRVVINTQSGSTLSATLEPSASAAPHIRTGAEVTAKIWRGRVTLVQVDGFNVPSTANPASTQSDAAFAGWLLVATGLVFGALRVRRWRLRTAKPIDASAAAEWAPRQGALQQEALPTGNLGWSVRPTTNLSLLGRYALGLVLVGITTLPALLDPRRMVWAGLFDLTLLGAVAVATMLGLRKTLVFADQHEVGKVNFLGQTVKVPLTQVLRADRFSVASRYAANTHLVFVGSDGRKAFEVAGPAWDYDRLEELCKTVGIRLTGGYDEQVSAFRLNQRVPGSVLWSRQLLVGLALVAFMVPFVLLIIGPTSR
jgi:hypothetical protein